MFSDLNNTHVADATHISHPRSVAPTAKASFIRLQDDRPRTRGHIIDDNGLLSRHASHYS